MRKNIQYIYKHLQNQNFENGNIGILSGLSGIVTFFFYYSKIMSNEKAFQKGNDLLEQIISIINSKNINPFFGTGLSGLGWTIDHLKKEELIDIDNDELLVNFDEYLYIHLINSLRNKNYDLVHGGIGILKYFLQRYKTTNSTILKKKYYRIIIESIHELKSISILSETTGRKWVTENNDVNFGLSHGMASIISVLTSLNNIDTFKMHSLPILQDSIKYLVNNQNNDIDFSYYANTKDSKIKKSRLAWCYGDLGIGLTLINASNSLNDNTLKKYAVKVLLNTTTRISKKDAMVNNSPICHGAYGIAKLYLNAYNTTKIDEFRISAKYWLNVGMMMIGISKEKESDIWKNIDSKRFNDLTLINGISGIGLVLLDFISETNNNWDDCLLL